MGQRAGFATQQHAANEIEGANVQQIEASYREFINSNSMAKTSGSIKTIPVVFHVVQNSSVELLSDANLHAQIEVMNEDFRKIAGTPGFGNGVDTEYQFCLAQIDPNGCPTTGINRVVSPAWADHDIADSSQFKGLIQWPPFNYLNIWVANTLYIGNPFSTFAGYTSVPQDLLSYTSHDGIVLNQIEVGRNIGQDFNGRAATRLAGHWLGLNATNTGGCAGNTSLTCLSAGDRVCDTPQSMASSFNCQVQNTCTDSPVDDPDPVNNYMFETDGYCWNMFTQGQKDRLDFMVASLRSNLVAPANLSQTGCDGSQSTTCPPLVNFRTETPNVCEDQDIYFEDLSIGSISNWNWSFPGGTPSTSTLANPIVSYSSPGLYNVTLEASNSAGADTSLQMDYVWVRNKGSLPLSEGFETGSPYPTEWYAEQSANGVPWTQVQGVSYSGNNCIRVNNLIQFPVFGEYSSLYSRAFDVTNAPGIQLSFQYAYKRFNAFQIDSLEVLVTLDCGISWQRVWQVYGLDIATTSGFTNQYWAPGNPSHWRQVNLNLDSLAGQGVMQVQFRVISLGGQALYLDDINILGAVSVEESVSRDWRIELSPNPVRNRFKVGVDLPQFSPLRVAVYDLHGKAVFVREYDEMAPGEHTLIFEEAEIGSLAQGTYLLQVRSNLGVHARKMVRLD